jgi:hypothetical protein
MKQREARTRYLKMAPGLFIVCFVGLLLVGAVEIFATVCDSPVWDAAFRGSLVVAIVSQKGNYIVVAADSREVDEADRPIDDKSCKIVALGGDTLFFETGTPLIIVRRGKSWNAQDVARAVYKESTRRDARNLSIAWGDRALSWFDAQSETDLKSVSEPRGGIITGGFINFKAGGKPSIQTQEVTFSARNHTLTRRLASEPPALGQVMFSGVGKHLIEEFFAGKTGRATRAFSSVETEHLVGVKSWVDARLARRAIQFAIANETGEDKNTIGGPIDVAILRKNGAIEWVSRKKACYALDEVPARR